MTFFEGEYDGLNIPSLVLSYEIGLRNLSSKEILKKQQDFFLKLKAKLETIDPVKLPEDLQLEYYLRQSDWLFIHEGNPGHHFQLNYESVVDVPAYRANLNYFGFREGWAAYVEDLGREVGLYQTPYHYYSKWEWDLIRSVRLILDVGINNQGWTDETALTEWKKHITGKDGIGIREIKRMRRWPAQVLSYKAGARAFQIAREHAQIKAGENFNLKEFHSNILSKRSIPVQLL